LEQRNEERHKQILGLLTGMTTTNEKVKVNRKIIMKKLNDHIHKRMNEIKFFSEVEGGFGAIIKGIEEDLDDPSFDPKAYITDVEIKTVFRALRSQMVHEMKALLFSLYPKLNKEQFPPYEKRKSTVLRETWQNHISEVENLDLNNVNDLCLKLFNSWDEKTDSNKALMVIVCRSFLEGKHFENDGKIENNYRELLYE